MSDRWTGTRKYGRVIYKASDSHPKLEIKFWIKHKSKPPANLFYLSILMYIITDFGQHEGGLKTVRFLLLEVVRNKSTTSTVLKSINLPG